MTSDRRIQTTDHPLSRHRSRRFVVQALGATTAAGLPALAGGRRTRAIDQDAAAVAVTDARDVVYGEVDGQHLRLDVADDDCHRRPRYARPTLPKNFPAQPIDK